MYRFQPELFNQAQLAAVLHNQGPCLVLAGAGSGKTRIIAHRTARLVCIENIAPSSIVAVSFTNKAADEMRTRVAQLIGKERASDCKLSTFHALGCDILRHHIHKLGYNTPFAIFDTADQIAVLKTTLKNLRLDGSAGDVSELLAKISACKSADLSPASMPSLRLSPIRLSLEKIYHLYNENLKALNAVDFDDLMRLPCRILEQWPDIVAKYREKWRYFLVDEYQDTNAPQFKLMQILAGPNPNLMAVGDDDQSIYAFRGADSGHILRFPEHFPDAKIIALEQNYRSTDTILNAANAVIKKNTNRHDKTLWCDKSEGTKILLRACLNEEDEAEFVANHIKFMRAQQNAHYRDFAVLYRVNPQARFFEEIFLREKLPYRVVGGTKFTDRIEIREVTAILRACVNAGDELALRRAVNLPPRGVTASHLEHFAQIAKNNGTNYERAIFGHGDFLPDNVRTKVEEWKQILLEHRRLFKEKKESPSKIAERLINALYYYPYLLRSAKSEEGALFKKSNAERFIESIDRFGEGDIHRFLERMTLESPQYDEDEDEIALMTFHSAKGLEFPFVFMVGCEEALLPHENNSANDEGIGEERRLCYVGITRAKNALCISYCAGRRKHGKMEKSKISRFIKDIPTELIIREQSDSESARIAREEEQRARNLERIKELKKKLNF